MTQDEPKKLTETELKVLIAAARGDTSQQTYLRGDLPLTSETIKSVKKRIREKTGARNMTAALVVAVARGELVIGSDGSVSIPAE